MLLIPALGRISVSLRPAWSTRVSSRIVRATQRNPVLKKKKQTKKKNKQTQNKNQFKTPLGNTRPAKKKKTIQKKNQTKTMKLT